MFNSIKPKRGILHYRIHSASFFKDLITPVTNEIQIESHQQHYIRKNSKQQPQAIIRLYKWPASCNQAFGQKKNMDV